VARKAAVGRGRRTRLRGDFVGAGLVDKPSPEHPLSALSALALAVLELAFLDSVAVDLTGELGVIVDGCLDMVGGQAEVRSGLRHRVPAGSHGVDDLPGI
jgi:hypothetical protein